MSRETDSIVTYIQRSGVPHRVTSTARWSTNSKSYHGRQGTAGVGLAVDLAGPKPGRDTPELLAIFNAFAPVEEFLAELIYAGAPYSIKGGKRVPVYSRARHHDHVHVAVERGTFLAWEGSMPDEQPIVPTPYPVMAAWPHLNPSGAVIGYTLVTADGAVYVFGEGGGYFGRLAVQYPSGG